MNQTTVKEYLRSVSILHIALMTGLCLLALITVLFTYINPIEVSNEWLRRVLLVVIPLSAVGSFVVGAGMYKRRRVALQQSADPLSKKMETYRGHLIFFYAMLEAPALLAITGFWLTGNYLFLTIIAFSFFLFILHKPSKEKLAEDLQLDMRGRALLDDPYAKLAELDTNK
jgi:hypothetical protein